MKFDFGTLSLDGLLECSKGKSDALGDRLYQYWLKLWITEVFVEHFSHHSYSLTMFSESTDMLCA